MVGQNRRKRDEREDESSHAESVETGSVPWRDIFVSGESTAESASTVDNHRLGGSEANRELRARTNAPGAFTRASDLFVGLSDSSDESVRTLVTELPQWFQQPEATEVRLRVGDDVFETDGFQRTGDPLTAEANTRTGTTVSITVVCTDQRPDTGGREWLQTEPELAEALVSLVTAGIGGREKDSLKRVSDGVVALDDDLNCTYADRRAERLLGRDSDELNGECLWEFSPELFDTAAEEKIRAAIETQSPRCFDRYRSQRKQWVEFRVHPTDDGVVIVFADITDSRTSERDVQYILEAAPVGLVFLDADGHITRANSRAEALLGLSRHELERKGYCHPDWDIWDEAGDPIAHEDHPVTRVRRTGETITGFTHGITLPDGSERWLLSNVTPIKAEDGSIEQVIVALEDVTAPKRLEQLVDTFQPVAEVLNDATEEQELEQTICELLTETREYQYARISDHTPGTALTESSLRDGSEAVAVSRSASFPIQSQVEAVPAQIAVETGEIQAVRKTQSDSRFRRWRADTLDHGFQGGVIVPLAHRNRVYGLLVLYTDRREAFGAREQTLLTTFGERVGQVLHSLTTERILHTDTVAELTFESTDSGSFFVAASDRLGCTIEVMDTIPTSDEMLIHYASVRGASLDLLGDIAENEDWEAQLRQVWQAEDPPGGEVEIGLRRRSLAQTVVRQDAVVTADTVTDGRAKVVCEVPLGDDVGLLVNRVQESFPETTLISKRESTPNRRMDAHAVGRVLTDVFETELTDRQQQVLRAAMYGGYFQSPRRSTATEIADALSLTQSTFSYHLRNAQQTLFERLFDRLQR